MEIAKAYIELIKRILKEILRGLNVNHDEIEVYLLKFNIFSEI